MDKSQRKAILTADINNQQYLWPHGQYLSFIKDFFNFPGLFQHKTRRNTHFSSETKVILTFMLSFASFL